MLAACTPPQRGFGTAQRENARFHLCEAQANMAAAIYMMVQGGQSVPTLPSNLSEGKTFLLRHVYENAGATPPVYPDVDGARDGEFAWCLDNVGYAVALDR